MAHPRPQSKRGRVVARKVKVPKPRKKSIFGKLLEDPFSGPRRNGR